MKRHLHAPSPGTVIAVIALVVALGGTAYAVKKNSIGAKQLKANAVTEKKIKNGAVTGGKLADNAVTGTKIADGVIGRAKLESGEQTAWALVNGTGIGSIVTQSGGISIASGLGGGSYFVRFPFTLPGHAIVGNVQSAQGGGEMATGICGNPSPVSGVEQLFCNTTSPADNNTSVARVETLNSAGSATAKSFYIAVLPK
jgi:hypothetical protein